MRIEYLDKNTFLVNEETVRINEKKIETLRKLKYEYKDTNTVLGRTKIFFTNQSLLLEYDKHESLIFLEAYDANKFLFHSKDLYAFKNVNLLVNYLTRFSDLTEVFTGSYIFMKIGISVYSTNEEEISSISVFKNGYYDSLEFALPNMI